MSAPSDKENLGPAPAENPDELDRQDMARLVGGHDGALNALMKRHGPKLFNYLLRNLQNEEDAADLAQETFVRVYQNRTKFDPDLKFSTWLYAIASNLVRTQFRYRSRHSSISADAENPETGSAILDAVPRADLSPSESLQTAETADAVRMAVTDLPEELRTPLILSEYEDLSHAEIGTILNCSAKAIETRLYRARKQLREALKSAYKS